MNKTLFLSSGSTNFPVREVIFGNKSINPINYYFEMFRRFIGHENHSILYLYFWRKQLISGKAIISG